ncbi:NADP-dependent oxidoreductase [Pedobacter sp. GSP4]|uniref:NADP-dependent oxidoreductase n=1 Tax=Pedobacter sp. GSP4 TaxID=3453716 RepID=UPI003EEF093C
MQAEEVLVAVKAISVNPVDAKVRAGHGIFQLLKEQKPLILGWDISGTVVAKGKETEFNIGDEVFGMINFPGHGKGYAEFVAAPAAQLALKPKNVSHAEAASATLAALTAYQALITHAKVQKGQRVLIYAAAGGVGHFAVQIAKFLGADVTGSSSKKNREFLMELGCDEHIDYHDFDWQLVSGQYDFVMDTVGGDNIEKSLLALKQGGFLISIPSGLSEEIQTKAKEKNVNAMFFLVSSNGDDMAVLSQWLHQGIIKPYIEKTFPFSEMAKAHQQIESGRTIGKVVVTL